MNSREDARREHRARRFERKAVKDAAKIRRDGMSAAAVQGALSININVHVFDVLTELPSGRHIRPALCAYRDCSSGKIMGWSLGETETTDLYRRALRSMLDAHGKPERVIWDN